MTNVKRAGTFSQKRGVCIGSYSVNEEQILADGWVATLPEKSIITSVNVNVKTASSTSGANLDIWVDGSVYVPLVPVDAVGVIDMSIPTEYFENGGYISIDAGSGTGGVPPAAGDLEVDVIIEYIETELTTGCLTTIED